MCEKCKSLLGCNVHMCFKGSFQPPASPQKLIERPAMQEDSLPIQQTRASASLVGARVLLDCAGKQ